MACTLQFALPAGTVTSGMGHQACRRTPVKRPPQWIGITRRLAGPAAAVLLGMALTPMLATPANAEAAVGYVRLAHLSPDTPKVDVYLAKVGDATFKEQKFEHVGYGVVS